MPEVCPVVLVVSSRPDETSHNPTEYIWRLLKTHEIGNLCARHVGEVRDLASRRLRSMQRRPALVRAFWQQAELAF